ncbi:hypothetical protein GCM10009030_23320 [Haloarcula pellucida]|uniref:Fructose-bisphosphate aldolase n=1 Tax=Haloarcula pellucida TaxID=1427151 RepID=A0A830GN10_9EURY|nr:hypothetical protein GCM10009030_23320 [Halomicroarcula pellucida]
MVKVKYPRSDAAMEHVVKAAADVLLVLSGGAKVDDRAFLELVERVVDAGVRGLAVGRNVWQREDPYRMLDALERVVFKQEPAAVALDG